ncbi:RES family NAD+ phosphorylase (plasmid) [Vibrio sp. SS-MA-C1-2]|uniref:RES family NAD+ phosphorylase n=1 Tax=Vibrio sp. SS-MA-C1-2 TaxID=2908646 RepID=UPI001F3E9D8F|nr:RES family NAD+ phosphorylase [Vibrio sp. SS-MA-C1-2]UJF20333.1 RES family NAD+ phosphorylase [Vibrio sp. SS-MA-C1-2]
MDYLWRISNYEDLKGLGGMFVDGRWHHVGQPIVYLSSSPSLALLEVMANNEFDHDEIPDTYKLLKVKVGEQPSIEKAALPTNWLSNKNKTQDLGSRWLKEERSLLLEVPSVILPYSTNYLMNPFHPQRDLLSIVEIINFPFDKRLIR